MRLFVFGMGYSARAVVARMRPKLVRVWGTTRDFSKAAELEALGVEPVVWDGSDPMGFAPPPFTGEGDHAQHGGRGIGSVREPSPAPPPSAVPLHRSAGEDSSAALAKASHILVSIPPGPDGDPVLRAFGKAIAASRPKAIVYLSTVGVYGDQGGGWVDEASECRPVSERSRQRVAAEMAWRELADRAGVPLAIIRLAGIYGPGRGPFEKIRRGAARRVIKPGQVFNRIHVDDISAIVEAALLRRADGVFNGADDEPAPPEEVLAHAAQLLGAPPPPEVLYAEANMTPMARSFYGENKRLRNFRIKQELGVRLAYPTYREGLRAVLEAERAGD